jgi:hypothetical protein
MFACKQGTLTDGGRPNTVDLLVLTSLVQLIFIFRVLITFITKQATLIRRSTVLILPLQLLFPDVTLSVVYPYP